jgi:cyclophilin family peptidyl-prolyl cis-trans isomerase
MVVNGARGLGLEVALPAREPRHGTRWYEELDEWTAEPRALDVVTDRGSFRIRLDVDSTPITSREIWDLAVDGFYDGLDFHRVVPNFVVQGGDPRGDGWGGPGFALPDEPSLVPFDSWRVGIATSGPNTGGCQLFVTLLPADRLTGHYTNFGEVVSGREVLTELRVGDRIRTIRTVTGGDYQGRGAAGTTHQHQF